MAKKGGGSSGTQQVQQTTFSLPEEFYPYVHETLNLARDEAYRPYESYEGPRIAPFSEDRLQAFDQVRDFQNVGQGNFAAGEGLTGIAALGAANANYDPNVAQWGNAAANQYMNPYINQVMDALQARSSNNYAQERAARDARGMASGAFGGYRQAVEEGVAYGQNQLNLNSVMADTLMKGYDTAFSNFDRDRSTDVQSRQFGAQQGLNRAQGLAAIGQQAFGQGVTRRDQELKGIGALNDAALTQERLTQASLDQGYSDFVNQRDYNRNNITWLNNIIRGNVTSPNSNTVGTTETNPYTQMLGMGIGAAGLANALGGGGSSQSVVGG